MNEVRIDRGDHDGLHKYSPEQLKVIMDDRQKVRRGARNAWIVILCISAILAAPFVAQLYRWGFGI